MNFQDELIKIFDECTAEIFEGETLDEDDKLDFELIRETIIAGLAKEAVSKEDQMFVLNNLDLYKRLFKTVLTDGEKEIKMVLVEILKRKRTQKGE